DKGLSWWAPSEKGFSLRASWAKIVAQAVAAPLGLAFGVSVAGGTSWLHGLVPSVFRADRAPRVVSVSMSPDAVLSIRFSERVRAARGSFVFACPRGHAVRFSLSRSPASSFRLTPRGNVPVGTLCRVTVFAKRIHDVDRRDPPDTMKKNFVRTLRVPPAS